MSVFLEVPAQDHVCANELAFAFRDRYPVSEGHTLVVTRRIVPDWFSATAAEQAALLALVEKVKSQLDEEVRAPDGYNVGFNAGEAAGQTVMHLHIHVIPRFRGDMDDPRGGVRHVIPSKGNYLAAAPPLATGGAEDPFAKHVLPLFARAEEIAIVAAFVQESGLDRIEAAVEAALQRGARIRLVTGNYLNITQAGALETLLDWERASQSDEHAISHLEARVIEVEKLPRGASFHPKSWRFEAGTFGIAFVGSSNLSRTALEAGIEWNLRVDRDRDASAYHRIKSAFDDLWARARRLDAEWIEAYARQARRVQLAMPPGEEESEALAAPPDPHRVQMEALARLRACRVDGRRRAIVVLATGLGKTWLAAFDYAQLREELGRRPKILFIAHRSELLKQASKTYRRQLNALGETARVGWFFGDTSELSADLVFASVAKLSRADHVAKLAGEHFDYVVVDEVHHAAADSYRRILDRVDPHFLLGLTATPDRADSADIMGLFDDFVAYRADIARGVELGRLTPFHYFGVKDDIDYANIPWRNRRFDPEALSTAAQTEGRMETLWRALSAHPGTRTLLFCCSIAHANYVRTWLRARALRVAAVYAAIGSDDREEALASLERGELDVVCAVDVFNEGVDVPTIDRVVMLRPTESSVVFLQQLGRGLRAAAGKTGVNVIDFVGNHRVFLDRLRALLSLGGGSGVAALKGMLESDAQVELPAGCSVEVELEAKVLLSRIFRVGGVEEVERVYRELCLERGADADLSLRPTAGELHRMGYLPSRLRERHGSWFEFLKGESGLAELELRALEAGTGFLRDLETTEMTKCFKMITLEVLLERDALVEGMPIDELATRAHALIRRSPELFGEVIEELRVQTLDDEARGKWIAYWRKNPIAAWTSAKRDARTWFRKDGDRLRLDVDVGDVLDAALGKLTRELVDYRLVQYRDRRRQEQATSESFTCRVLSNQRDPILKLPQRGLVTLPTDETEVRLQDGAVWQFRFAKEYCNVARPAGTGTNQLPDLLRRWFGPRAGEPGTNYQVRFRAAPDGLWAEPVQVAAFELATRRKIVAYPDLRAAAGHPASSVDVPADDLVSLPLESGDADLFAVRVSGSSMDGGKQPLHDGDWAIMRLARSMAAGAVENRVVLVNAQDAGGGSTYLIKRLERDGGGWKLTSDNPDGPSFNADETMMPIARLERAISPEALAPPIGTVHEEERLADGFDLEGLHPISGRHGGHLFIFVAGKRQLVEPDRVTYTAVTPRPSETAYVLARRAEGFQYLGVGRQTEASGLWSLPPVDFPTWRAWGEGRSASRRLPEGTLAKAQLASAALLAMPEDRRRLVHSEGRAARVLGSAQQGGLRIAGEAGGFAERTVSLVDLAWVIATADQISDQGGILDEQRVNSLRYLDGTPKGSTRWIDTGWAIAAWNLAKPLIRDPIASASTTRRIHRSEGTELDASFSVERIGDVSTIVFESRGGTRGSAQERNVDYAEGLELLLERLKAMGLNVADIVVESRDTSALPIESRRVVVADQPYPISITDAAGLRKKISASQTKVGRAPGAKGSGNRTRRLRIFLERGALASPRELGDRLAG